MKNLFTLIALGSFGLVSADQYYQSYESDYGSCPSCNLGGYYQDQSSYYQQSGDQYQFPQGYSRNDRYQGNYPSYYQQQPRNPGMMGSVQSYDQNQPQQSRNQSYDQNQQYYQTQQTRNQPYGQTQQTRNQPYGQTQQTRSYDQTQQTRNQSYDQNQQNYQQQSNQRDQQRNFDNRSQGNQGTAPDQEIKEEIQDTIGSGWFSKGFQNVSYDVNNGNVTLKGSVDTLENKNKVEDSVKKINGVKQVNNQIRIVKENQDTYSDSDMQNATNKYPQDFASNDQDRQLNARIREKLNSGWFSRGYETLVIRTNNGVVTVSGAIDKVEDIQKINDQIKDVQGVRSVNNQLTAKNR